MSIITNMMAKKAILYCFYSNFVVCESLLEFNSSDSWYETNVQDSVDSSNICLKGYVPMIQQGLCLSYEGETCFYITVHPLNSLRILVYVFLLVLLHSMSYSFFFCQSSSLILYHQRQSSLSRPYCLFLENLRFCYESWLTCSGGADSMMSSVLVFKWLSFIIVLLFWISSF